MWKKPEPSLFEKNSENKIISQASLWPKGRDFNYFESLGK